MLNGWPPSPRKASPTRTTPSTGCARRASPSPGPPGWSGFNGGKPIYSHEPPKPAPAPRPQPERPKARELSPKETEALETLVAAAKGYRPLYQLLEAEIRRALPGVGIAPKAGYISIGHPREFAAITLHATELRLGLDLGERAFDAQLQRSKLKGPGRAISHMLVLTDARQVNADLLALLAAANARVNA